MNYSDSSDEDEKNPDIFGLTKAKKLAPRTDVLKGPTQRVKIVGKEANETSFYPDVDQVMCRLRAEEGIKRARIRRNPFHQELKLMNQRIQKINRGVPLQTVLQNEGKRTYPLLKEKYKFNGVGEKIDTLPQITFPRQLQKVQFVIPASESQNNRVPLSSRINTADVASRRLTRLINEADKFEIQAHNEMVTYINHANERRERAIKQLYEDMNNYGYEEAERRAKRAAQKSRLRIMTNYNWWEDFLNFAFEKTVGKHEEKVIEMIAKADPLTSTVFIRIVQDVNNANYKNERSLELLNWVNKRCKLIDDNVLNMVQEPSRPHTGRPSRRSIPPQSI